MMEFLDANYQALVSILLGIIFLVLGLSKKKKKSHLLKNGVKTTGVVVDYESGRRDNSTGMSMYYPIIEFEDSNEKIRQVKCNFGYNFKIFKNNQQVEVYYDSNNPHNFIVNDSKTKIVDYVFPLAGLVFLLFGLFALISKLM